MNRYLSLTRSYSYSLLFALPLLLLYEAGAIFIARGETIAIRNGADVMLRSVLTLGGVNGSVAVTGVLVGVAIVLIVLERRRRSVPLRAAPFLGMLGESVAYALLLGVVVGTATQWILRGVSIDLQMGGASMGLVDGIVLSIGAGVYEEIIFRVVLVGGLFALFRASGLEAGRAGLFSVLVAALLFSAFHYIGPYGDVVELSSFLFRFLAGVVFSALFLVRGFGIVVWTHALYDIFLVIAMGV